MTTQRMYTFDVPHKGIRNALSQLSLIVSKCDYTSKAEVKDLYLLGTEVFEILTTHAHDENEVSLKALEEKCSGASTHYLAEHTRIDIAQSKLEDLLKEIYETSTAQGEVAVKGREFYSLLSDFHAMYLQHMAEEEYNVQKLLWQYFTDEELAQHRAEVMKRLKPDTLLLWFKFIVPAQNHTERVGLLTGFKAFAPPEFFKKAMLTIKNALTVSEWHRLEKALQ